MLIPNFSSKGIIIAKIHCIFFALLISLNLGKMFIFSLKIQQGHRQYIIELLPFDFWQRYQGQFLLYRYTDIMARWRTVVY